ncbi:hypothetical protein [Candidatus Similichlamydia laticola]|uniref:Uncharacterized protein n=1 Tax=Candidatus Similichlamydia laticola TaxID=2170265 RepID=A0A369KAQ0_9BACT|nr:hypothetical protein [Candidatus Similichlamydia laticola]RDB31681.1 hypothetical protein HAT2_00189 [Candidatus Similichlamydia laticola]
MIISRRNRYLEYQTTLAMIFPFLHIAKGLFAVIQLIQCKALKSLSQILFGASFTYTGLRLLINLLPEKVEKKFLSHLDAQTSLLNSSLHFAFLLGSFAFMISIFFVPLSVFVLLEKGAFDWCTLSGTVSFILSFAFAAFHNFGIFAEVTKTSEEYPDVDPEKDLCPISQAIFYFFQWCTKTVIGMAFITTISIFGLFFSPNFFYLK